MAFYETFSKGFFRKGLENAGKKWMSGKRRGFELDRAQNRNAGGKTADEKKGKFERLDMAAAQETMRNSGCISRNVNNRVEGTVFWKWNRGV